MIIYHITTRTSWEDALRAGSYRGDTLSTDGFIHASTREQVAGTGNYLFRGQQGLVLLCIDTAKLKPELRFEQAPGTDQKFPHLYGPLNLDAVAGVVDFPPEPDGAFKLPENMI